MNIFAILNTAILFGALQGLIISTLLLLSQNNRVKNRILASLILLISVASLKLYGNAMGWFTYPFMRWVETLVPLIVIMPVGPFIYFYVKASIEPDFFIARREKRHFLPVLIDTVPQLTAIVFLVGVYSGVFAPDPQPWGAFIDNYNVYSDLPRWLSISFYLYLSTRFLRHQQNGAHLLWLYQFLTAFRIFQVIWLLYLIPYILPGYTNFMLDRFNWYPVYIPLAVLIYWLGIQGYMASRAEAPRLKKPVIESQQAARTLNALKLAMQEDQLYLNPNLTVAIVSAHIGVQQKTVSAVLNQHLQKSFNEFVNGYRVEAVRQQLLEGAGRERTIAGLAYENGFNSLATFQRAFKSVTGQSPTEFLAKTPKNLTQIRI